MHGHEHDIPVLISQLHHLVDPAFVITYLDKSSENSDSMVDMHHIVAYIECSKIIDGKLFALVYRPSDTYPVKTVEYLVIRIAAYLILIVDESVMYIFTRTEFRYESPVLRQY